MIPGAIEGCTRIFRKPADMSDEECHPLHVREGEFNGLPTCTSAWFPTPEELARLNAGGAVYLMVVGGQPPVWVTA